MNLLVKPKKNSREIVSVTPESAGWRYVSFSAHQLAAWRDAEPFRPVQRALCGRSDRDSLGSD